MPVYYNERLDCPGCPAPQVTVKVKVKSRLNMVIGADFHIGPNNHVYQQTG